MIFWMKISYEQNVHNTYTGIEARDDLPEIVDGRDTSIKKILNYANPRQCTCEYKYSFENEEEAWLWMKKVATLETELKVSLHPVKRNKTCRCISFTRDDGLRCIYTLITEEERNNCWF